MHRTRITDKFLRWSSQQSIPINFQPSLGRYWNDALQFAPAISVYNPPCKPPEPTITDHQAQTLHQHQDFSPTITNKNFQPALPSTMQLFSFLFSTFLLAMPIFAKDTCYPDRQRCSYPPNDPNTYIEYCGKDRKWHLDVKCPTTRPCTGDEGISRCLY
jgi:hypothetical protein